MVQTLIEKIEKTILLPPPRRASLALQKGSSEELGNIHSLMKFCICMIHMHMHMYLLCRYISVWNTGVIGAQSDGLDRLRLKTRLNRGKPPATDGDIVEASYVKRMYKLLGVSGFSSFLALPYCPASSKEFKCPQSSTVGDLMGLR